MVGTRRRARTAWRPPTGRARPSPGPGDPELAVEHGNALVVRAQRPDPVVPAGMQRDQVAVRRLVEWVEQRASARRLAIAERLSPRREAASLRRARTAVASRWRRWRSGGDPVVVAAGEQVAPVLVGGRGKGALVAGLEPGLRRPLEAHDVDVGPAVLEPADRAVVHGQVPIGLVERQAQVVQRLAQVRAGLLLVRVRPEQERQTLARDGPIAVHDQEAEQRLEAGRRQLLDHLAARCGRRSRRADARRARALASGLPCVATLRHPSTRPSAAHPRVLPMGDDPLSGGTRRGS